MHDSNHDSVVRVCASYLSAVSLVRLFTLHYVG